ncbi:hypothetical protein P12x_002829 [Tundrisphaera lichenicola]|uniref:hypothetical protein n=1 Tax=Tundrisphaera lichenicola TaxID=2029860 RepID=UPI003EB8C11C
MRFTVRRMMVAVAFVASVMGLFITTPAWVTNCGRHGDASVPLVFHAVDDRDGRPVVGAKVEMPDEMGSPSIVMTEADGSARTACQARFTMNRNPFVRPYRVFTYWDQLRVRADGYQPVEGMLRDFMTDPAFRTDRTAHPPILIRMKRKSGISKT